MVVHANRREIRPQILTNLMLVCLWLPMHGLQRTRVCLSDFLDLCIMKSFYVGHNSVQWVLPPDARKTKVYCSMVLVPALRQVQCEWIQSQRRSNRHINTLGFLPCVFVDQSHVIVERRIGFGPRQATIKCLTDVVVLLRLLSCQKRFPRFRCFLLSHRSHQSDFR